jgi:hypothetical protein
VRRRGTADCVLLALPDKAGGNFMPRDRLEILLVSSRHGSTATEARGDLPTRVDNTFSSSTCEDCEDV